MLIVLHKLWRYVYYIYICIYVFNTYCEIMISFVFVFQLYSAYPEYAPEEIARSTANQDQESLQTVERLQYISNYSNEFFAEHNNKVDDSFYHGEDIYCTV